MHTRAQRLATEEVFGPVLPVWRVETLDEASVSKGLILYHFKNKDNLLLTTMTWALLRTAERIRKGIEGVDDPHVAVQALIDAVWVGPKQNRDFYLLYLDLIEHAARVPSFRGLPTVTREIIEGLYAEIIREGIAQRVFAVEDADEAAATMRAFIEGTFLQCCNNRTGASPTPATGPAATRACCGCSDRTRSAASPRPR